MRDPWSQGGQGGIAGGRWAWVGRGKVVVRKRRQLYSNISKNKNKNLGGKGKQIFLRNMPQRIYVNQSLSDSEKEERKAWRKAAPQEAWSASPKGGGGNCVSGMDAVVRSF